MRFFAAIPLVAWALAASAAVTPSRDERPEGLRAYGKASGTVVVAMSPTCPCSQSHEPTLAKLSKEFRTFGFVGLRADGDAQARYFAAKQLPFPVVAVPGAAQAIGALKTPHVFVYDAHGKLRYRGGVDDSHDAARAQKPYLANALAALAAGNGPDPEETRPLGCRVDWE